MNRTISIFAIVTICFGLLLGSVASFANVNAQVEKQQIIIKDNIKSYEDYGLETSTDYIETFTPPKVFDNLLLSPQVKNTAWSQRGDAGFIVNLNNVLSQPICSAEIITKGPMNSPFLLTIGNKSVEGLLDTTQKTVSFGPECAKAVELIKFDVKQAFDVWSPIEEIKLFTEKVIPPIDPPVCPPGTYYDANLKKCVQIENPIENGTAIVNSTISLTVSNSTITINADENSKVIANNPTILSPNTITIPEPEGPNDDDSDEDDEEEEEGVKGDDGKN